MNTFLPYKSFAKTAKVLDNRRLGKQRVECYQILKVLNGEGKRLKNGNLAWENHPAVKMWKGYEDTLVDYGIAICDEWISRGYNDTCRDKIKSYHYKGHTYRLPKFIGNRAFHDSHKSNLLRKFPEHYSKYFKNITNNLPYIWPE